MNTQLDCTNHAVQRQAQRNLSDDDIQFVLAYGQQYRCAGTLHIFLGRRNVPIDKATARRFGHLEGTVLVVDDLLATPVLITAYRNRNGLKAIRTKTKYDRSRTAKARWN